MWVAGQSAVLWRFWRLRVLSGVAGAGTFVGEKPDDWSTQVTEMVASTDIMEIMEVRLRIEPQLAQLAAMRAKPAEVERMRALVKKTGESTDADAKELWDGSLHRQIAQSAGNKLFLSIFDVVNRIRQTMPGSRYANSPGAVARMARRLSNSMSPSSMPLPIAIRRVPERQCASTFSCIRND